MVTNSVKSDAPHGACLITVYSAGKLPDQNANNRGPSSMNHDAVKSFDDEGITNSEASFDSLLML
jgi:hypothetical protein